LACAFFASKYAAFFRESVFFFMLVSWLGVRGV